MLWISPCTTFGQMLNFLIETTEKTYQELKTQAEKERLVPNSEHKVYLSTHVKETNPDRWLCSLIKKQMQEQGLDDLYIV